ncbi:uncharacterized protein LOC126567623 [Anopheles maculipalpis]|uniref:uncharacterized protein LOC126567623 n=1 Tax=Anopheles maculipalpis TaxID=1496333 RepID=UPI002158C89D|nr:uncharacterized protein LOC126567623 [Anopheles maculipalpis]
MGKSGSQRVCVLCQNRASVTDDQTDDAFERITYHKFPANQQRLDQWLELCGLPKGSIPPLSYKFVCSTHFEPECFERDLRAELLYGTKRMTLRKDALPTIRYPKEQQLKRKLTTADESSDEDEIQKRKVEVDKLLNGETPVTETIVNPFRKRTVENSASPPSEVKSYLTQSEMVQRIKDLEQETTDQRIQITHLQRTINVKTEKINLAKAEMVNAAISLQELKDHENRHVKDRVTEILSDRFGEGQLATIMAGPVDGSEATLLQVLWTETELVQALKLRCISKEAYEFVRQQMRYPLPEVTKIERWIHGVYLETGHNATALSILQIYASTLKDVERICTLNILHINTPVRYHYDSKRDQMLGPNAQLSYLTVQGLFSAWQQIVQIDIDLNVSREMMEKMLTDLHHIGYKVVAITTDCDNGVGNIWRTLNVSIEQHYIQHPVTGHSVYVYACPERTLVAIHRVLVEDGFVMHENNLTISSATLMPFMFRQDIQGGEIYQRYLTIEILQDMAHSSDLSREFISSTTTNTLRLLSSNESEGSDLLSTLTTLFDLFTDWYELCTTTNYSDDSSALKQQQITKLPYGVCEDEQNIVLDGMFDVMETIRCADPSYDFLPPAILMSINSMRKLLADLRAAYPGQIEGLQMLRMSTIPMKETMLKFRDIFCQDSKAPSVNDILIHLCTAVASVGQDSHATNILLKMGGFSGEWSLKSLRLEDDPPDTEVGGVSDQNACDFLTHLAVVRLGQKYDYLGERTISIERNNQQYGIKPPDGDIFSCVTPSALWTEQAKRLESYLRNAIQEKKTELAKGLIEFIIDRHPRMGRDLVELYVRKRIAIKVQTLNSKIEDGNAQTSIS